jgi:hypothetical protein
MKTLYIRESRRMTSTTCTVYGLLDVWINKKVYLINVNPAQLQSVSRHLIDVHIVHVKHSVLDVPVAPNVW